MSRIVRRLAARRDLIDNYRYLARADGYRSADRFSRDVETTMERVASMPGIGEPYLAEHPDLDGLRVRPVSRFKSYLIFYRPLDDGIELVRILHAARDIPNILAGEFGVDLAGGEDRDRDH